MSNRLTGLRVLVSGAGSGIGRAATIKFVTEGARVGMLDVAEPALKGTADLVDDPAAVLSLVADVTDEGAVAAAVDTAVAAWGGLDAVVSNAAVQLFDADGPVHQVSAEAWGRTIAVNLTGAFHVCKHGVRALLAAGAGNVIITVSPTALCGVAGFAAYSASKGGTYALVKSMARDYAAAGIRVNGVLPGFTHTPLVKPMTDQPETVESFLINNPIPRPGTAEEVANLMAFLASDEASYCTGGIHTVDGGMTAVI